MQPADRRLLIPDLDKAVNNNKINNLSELKYINI